MLRVVLIDDAREVREAIADLLRNAGHVVVGEADDGASGVHTTSSRRPDLVVVDWRMPGMDGIEATRQIRTLHPDVAVVALCSTNASAVRRAFLTAGADAFVDKRDVRELIPVVQAIAENLHAAG